MSDQITTPAQLLDYIRNNEDFTLDFGMVDREWPVLCVGQADDLIAEDTDLRVWLSRTVMAERLDSEKPYGQEEVGEIERRTGPIGDRRWISEPWMIDWTER